MKDDKNLIDKKDTEKVSGGSMKHINIEGSFSAKGKDKDNDKISGNIKFSGPLTITYCDVCGKDFDDGEKVTTFMYNGTVHHMCENCYKGGCMSIFK